MPFDPPAAQDDAAQSAGPAPDGWLAMLLPGPAARARLRGMREDITRALPAALRDVYAQWQREPALAPLLGDVARVARLRRLQEAHWTSLLAAGFDADDAARTLRVGDVHARQGLDARWYIGGTCLVLEQLVAVLARRHRARPALAEDLAALLRAVFLDMELSLRAWQRREEADHMRAEVLALADLIEGDVSLAVGAIALQGDRLAEGAGRLAEVAGDVRGVAEAVSGAVELDRWLGGGRHRGGAAAGSLDRRHRRAGGARRRCHRALGRGSRRGR